MECRYGRGKKYKRTMQKPTTKQNRYCSNTRLRNGQHKQENWELSSNNN